MSRPERSLLSLDYKELYGMGRQILKKREKGPITGEIEMDPHRAEPIRIRCDVEDFFESYELEEMTEEEDLIKYVGEIKLLKQEYHRIHTLLKDGDSGGFATTLIVILR